MKVLLKLAVIYSATSMFCGFIYGFGGLTLIDMHYIELKSFNLGIFIFLWLGPLALAFSVGLPIFIYKVLTGKVL